MKSKWNSNQSYVISGAFGGFNLGDEAILETTLLMLRSRHPQCRVSAIVDESRMDPSIRHHYTQDLNLHIVNKRRPVSVMRSTIHNRLILGGGQVLTRHPTKQIAFVAFILVISAMSRRRPLMIGAGIEDASGIYVRGLVRWLYPLFHEIYVRDDESLEKLDKAGLPKRASISVAADVVFTGVLAGRSSPPIHTDGAHSPPITIIAVEQIPGMPTYPKEFWIELVRLAAHQRPKDLIAVIGHDLRERFDIGMVNAIQADLEQDPMLQNVCFPNVRTLSSCLALYRSAECVVSARMHPIILGAIHGSALVALPGRSKLRNLATVLGLEQVAPDPESLSGALAAPQTPEAAQLDHLRRAAELNYQSI